MVFICTGSARLPLSNTNEGRPPLIGEMIIRLHTIDAAWNLAFESW